MASTNAHPQPPLPKMSKLFIESEPISSTPLPTLKIFYPNWDIDISRSMFKAHQISWIKAESVSYQPRVKFCYKYLFSKGKNAHNLLSQGIKLEFYISCDVIPNHHPVTYCQSQTNSSKFLAYHLRKKLIEPFKFQWSLSPEVRNSTPTLPARLPKNYKRK